MKTVVILGAGLGSRLNPITNHIPKVLVNYKQHTVLKYLHDVYSTLGADRIIVVVHSKYKDTVKGYANSVGINIEILCVDEPYGSYYAIGMIAGEIIGDNVVFNWCDVIPEFNNFSWDQTAIYTYGNSCRYKFKNRVIYKSPLNDGNVVGVYQFKRFPDVFGTRNPETIKRVSNGEDLIDNIYGKACDQEELKNLVDIGDLEKLKAAHKNVEINREFNEIEINETTVVKTALNQRGQELQFKELQWYSKVNTQSVPTIYTVTENSFSMERINGTPMSNFIKFSGNKVKLIDEILKACTFSHDFISMPEQSVKADVKKEAYTKVIERCESIKELIDSFGVKYVNGLKLGRLKTLLNKAYPYLVNQALSTPYSAVIHGDPNFSNIFMGLDGKIKFIDPRGYFGFTEVAGPRIYDESKILYALSGYDEFNSDPSWGGLSIHGQNATVNITPLFDGYEDLEFVTLEHKLWLAIIWVSLAGYFKNNPLKAVSAYFYGMYLLTKTLNGLPRVLKDSTTAPDLLAPVTCSIITKCPSKWRLFDLETGQTYIPNPAGQKIGSQWTLYRGTNV